MVYFYPPSIVFISSLKTSLSGTSSSTFCFLSISQNAPATCPLTSSRPNCFPVHHQNHQLSCPPNLIPTFLAIPRSPPYARKLTPKASSMAPATIVSPIWGKAVPEISRHLILYHDRRFIPFKWVEAPT